MISDFEEGYTHGWLDAQSNNKNVPMGVTEYDKGYIEGFKEYRLEERGMVFFFFEKGVGVSGNKHYMTIEVDEEGENVCHLFFKVDQEGNIWSEIRVCRKFEDAYLIASDHWRTFGQGSNKNLKDSC